MPHHQTIATKGPFHRVGEGVWGWGLAFTPADVADPVKQLTVYYPFGMAHHYNRPNNDNKYLYNQKELQDDELGNTGLNWYDYGARFYDPSLGRWHVVDPLAEKYYSLTPYHYTNNNPVLFVDYDGRDYGLHFDHYNNTVTIRATYYSTPADVASAQQSVDFWNNQSGSHTYTIGKGDAAVTYTVNFELTAVEVAIDPSGAPPLNQLNVALAADKTGEGNVFVVVPDAAAALTSNTNGTTIGGNYIQVKDSRKSTDTGSHEVGHTLGMGHSSNGVMTSSSSSSRRSNNTNRANVKDAIINPVKGKVNYEIREDGTKVFLGKGTVKNATSYTNVWTDWGGQQRTAIAPDKLNGSLR